MRNLLIILALVLSIYTAKSQLSGQAKIDSLLKELPKIKKDTNGVNLLAILSWELNYSNSNKGIKYGLKGLKLAQNINWKYGEAICLNNIGYNYINKSDYPKALEYYYKALKVNKKLGNKPGISLNLGNIGIIYEKQSDYPKALEYYYKSLKINEELGNERLAAGTIHNIGVIYKNQSNYPKALEYYFKAKKINEKPGGNKIWLANNLAMIGIIYNIQSNYKKALEFYHKALKISEDLGNKISEVGITINIGNLYMDQSDYPKALEYYYKSLKMSKELRFILGVASNLGNIGEIYLNLSKDSILSKISKRTELISLNTEINLNKSIENTTESIKIFEELGAVHELSYFYKNLHYAYKQKGQYLNAIEAMDKQILFKDSIYNQENNDKISALEKAREDDLNRLQIEKQEILLKSKEDEKQLILMSAGGALLSVILILIIIVNQRRKSEKLLLNILPASIAKRLKDKEENIADDFDSATTIFIDLVGFTSFAKDKKASEVVKVLNNIFHRFDDLVKKHGLEKIKTMGDGYLAVSGVPDPDSNHCQIAINFALEVRTELAKFNKEMGLDINARIGLETGPLVAGVIGSSKFIYDIWGDSVNTASRMESTGIPGKIQIT